MSAQPLIDPPLQPHPPLQVTPGGHDLAVWAPTIAAAPRVSPAGLAAALLPPTTRSDRPAELVVVAAHPDDETLGLGRLASVWARQIGPVTGVLATVGEACVDHVMDRPAGLGSRRVAEWHAALDHLGVGDRHVLDLPDGRVAEHTDTLTAALSRVVVASVAAGRRVVLAGPWRGDPHPDHRAAGRATAAVAAATGRPLLEFGVWMTFWADPSALAERDQRLLVVEHDPESDRAHGLACRAFESQLEPLSAQTTPVVPAAMLEHHQIQLVVLSPALAAVLTRGDQP